jgi:ferritin-like metal-binding protein YciE
MNLTTLTDLLVEELRDLYDAEQQLAKALPLMAEKAFTPELKEAFELHAEQTRSQAQRLDTAFGKLGIAARGKHCKAMEGLIAEAQELLEEEENADPAVLDAGLITAAQKVEHYEIAGYGSARTFAKQLGAKEVAALLQQTLDEEAETDRKLTEVAELIVNQDAAESDAEVLAEADEEARK